MALGRYASAMTRPPTAIVTLLLGLLANASAFGWSTKEHIQLTRIAAAQLIDDGATPTAMKEWLRNAAPGVLPMDEERAWWLTRRVGPLPRGADGLMFWAVKPDIDALTDRDRKPVDPFGVPERLLHYIDLEYFGPRPPVKPATRPQAGGPELLTSTRPATAPDVPPAPLTRPSADLKPALADVPRSLADPRLKDAGMLPHRVQYCFDELVKQLRAGRLNDRPGQYPRDEHAARWAGYLAHYAQDNTQPHHATVDYKSRSYFPADVTNPPDVHALFEYGLGDGEHDDLMPLRGRFWGHFAAALADANDPTTSNDPFDATIEVSLASYDALDLIGRAAAGAYDRAAGRAGRLDATRFYEARGTVRDQEMTVLELKARQMAWAVRRTTRLWLDAWHAGISVEQ